MMEQITRQPRARICPLDPDRQCRRELGPSQKAFPQWQERVAVRRIDSEKVAKDVDGVPNRLSALAEEYLQSLLSSEAAPPTERSSLLPSRHTTSHPIGKRLKQARLAVGLSQAQLGICAGVDPSVASTRVNQYERQRHQPAFEIVRRLAQVLKKRAPYFYAVDNSLAALIAIYGRLSTTERAKLLALARQRQTD